MSNLQQVIDKVKSDMANKYVFVHIKDHELRTLIDGLEEQQKEIEKLKEDSKHTLQQILQMGRSRIKEESK